MQRSQWAVRSMMPNAIALRPEGLQLERAHSFFFGGIFEVIQLSFLQQTQRGYQPCFQPKQYWVVAELRDEGLPRKLETRYPLQ